MDSWTAQWCNRLPVFCGMMSPTDEQTSLYWRGAQPTSTTNQITEPAYTPVFAAFANPPFMSKKAGKPLLWTLEARKIGTRLLDPVGSWGLERPRGESSSRWPSGMLEEYNGKPSQQCFFFPWRFFEIGQCAYLEPPSTHENAETSQNHGSRLGMYRDVIQRCWTQEWWLSLQAGQRVVVAPAIWLVIWKDPIHRTSKTLYKWSQDVPRPCIIPTKKLWFLDFFGVFNIKLFARQGMKDVFGFMTKNHHILCGKNGARWRPLTWWRSYAIMVHHCMPCHMMRRWRVPDFGCLG